MKKIIGGTKFLFILISLLLIVSGCSQSAAKDSQASASQSGGNPPAGGDLTYALATSPDTLDPHRSSLAVSVRAFRTIYDSLVVQDENNEIQPWLATEWVVSEDGKSYTFKLREDVKFHDGTPFNAEAVKYSFDRIIDPKTKALNSVALLAPYESAEVLDDHTVKLNLKSPSASFLSNLSQAMLGIVSPTAAEKYGEQFGKNPVGTGPFEFVSWTENAEIKVEKNTDYNWAPSYVKNEGAPYLDTLTFKIIPEEATRIGSVQSGQVLAAETVPPQNIAALEKDPNYNLLKVNTLGLPYTLFFNQREEPWSDVNVRKAVLQAVDVDAIVKTLYMGTYDRAWSPLTPGILGYDKSLENSWKVDVAAANKLLDEAGYKVGADGIREKNGEKLTLNYVDSSPNREKRNDIAVIVQQQLKKVGIAVEVNITPDFRSVIYENSDYDLYGNSMMNSDPNALRGIYHTPEETQVLESLVGGYDDRLDELLEQGTVEADPAKREEIYKEAQHIIIEQAMIIPIYVFPYTVAASNKVDGIVFDALGYPLFNDATVSQ
ncbi:ABC transporter substrate-binding protein [Planomicrobium sp. CPCC 101110]|uniref:ABC transporter substrate-binding protein n=1 Tax=Planomicrobium sp. CPCC 101110 TaxID=2599619 RepID=UPI0011B6EA2F|nr:ABC transporter substrate-binding protein [Planomicrobium sp. CPCC 101110]TWT25190.1 ABC transporter substrate-binding protein [Planomicrobium sp. CPCC 101110]